VIYLHQEGRGIGLANKLRAYALQDQGLDTVDANIKLGFAADLRNYRSAAQILEDIGIKRVRLITGNPEKIAALEDFGLEVIERVEMPTQWDQYNEAYLRTKVERFGHMLTPAKEK
jgi:3,4-dihydroxy 2-butanone 4-phosphate synthase/GTP cyclohydrolase II